MNQDVTNQTSAHKYAGEWSFAISHLEPNLESNLESNLELRCKPPMGSSTTGREFRKRRKLVNEYLVNGDTYSGTTLEDERHGWGQYVWTDQSKYIGQWYKDQREGYGVYFYQNGDTYYGEFRNNLRCGKGQVITYARKVLYWGDWLNNKYHGHGIYNSSTGEKYEGQWVNGERHGQGMWSNLHGNVYDGNWEHNIKRGKGKLTLLGEDFRVEITGIWNDNEISDGVITKIKGKDGELGISTVKNYCGRIPTI